MQREKSNLIQNVQRGKSYLHQENDHRWKQHLWYEVNPRVGFNLVNAQIHLGLKYNSKIWAWTIYNTLRVLCKINLSLSCNNLEKIKTRICSLWLPGNFNSAHTSSKWKLKAIWFRSAICESLSFRSLGILREKIFIR